VQERLAVASLRSLARSRWPRQGPGRARGGQL